MSHSKTRLSKPDIETFEEFRERTSLDVLPMLGFANEEDLPISVFVVETEVTIPLTIGALAKEGKFRPAVEFLVSVDELDRVIPAGRHPVYLTVLLEERGEFDLIESLWTRILEERAGACIGAKSSSKERLQEAFDDGCEFYLNHLDGKRQASATRFITELSKTLQKTDNLKKVDQIVSAPIMKARRKTEKLFWQLIDVASSDIESVLAGLRGLNAGDLVWFHNTLMSKLGEIYNHDFWAVVYVNGRGQTDDSFLYFCAGVIARGKASFKSSLREPVKYVSGLSANENSECEELLYSAMKVYEEQSFSDNCVEFTGDLIPEITGRKWTEKSLPRRYPELAKLKNKSKI